MKVGQLYRNKKTGRVVRIVGVAESRTERAHGQTRTRRGRHLRYLAQKLVKSFAGDVYQAAFCARPYRIGLDRFAAKFEKVPA